MKRLFLILNLFVFFGYSFAQIQQPVKWTFSSELLNEKEAVLVFKARIENGWHLYSQFIGEGGPVPTSFSFSPNGNFSKIGKVSESPKPIKIMDDIFGMEVSYFERAATFKQKIKINTEKDFVVKGTLEFMVCDDKQCLPPEEVEFSIPVKVPVSTKDSVNVDSAAALQNKDTLIKKDTTKIQPTIFGDTNEISAATSQEDRSLWMIFMKGFLFGFVALLMPCIFPMIPLTVSFFTKRAKNRIASIRDAIVYGLSIIIIYVGLGLGVTVLLGASALNELSSNAIFNLVFFLVLLIFAASFFGAFEITLPSSWSTKADRKAEKGGFVGIFFMAVVLAIASFSCTGPLIGTLLVDAANNGEYMGPFMGMFGFSLSLSLPFALFAIFPSWLSSMPKSGGWLNSVKVTLGFIELAFALKFLSNADMAYHWRLLDREVFIVLWVIIFALLGIYLLGKLKFSHDSEVKYISVPRLFLAILSLGFAVYMIPGLWGAPLKAISGYLPHVGTQDFDLYTQGFSNSTNSSAELKVRKYNDKLHAPLGIEAFFDYDEGLAYAKKINKPIFLDFTGHSCTNCRKMENVVWPNSEVLKRLKEDFVVISLYVDDRTELPESEHYVSPVTGKKVNTLGKRNVDIQVTKFKSNAQPLYVVVDHDGNALTEPYAYNQDVEAYVQFLDKGINTFEQKNK